MGVFSLRRCRISRILQSPQGYALLIGVGGSGKQSLSRLAAYVCSLEVFQITLTQGFGIQELRVSLVMGGPVLLLPQDKGAPVRHGGG